MKPQTLLVLAYLRSRGRRGVTALEALDEVGTSRLAARVAELRAEGYEIDSTYVTTPGGKRIVRYVIHEAPQQLTVGLR